MAKFRVFVWYLRATLILKSKTRSKIVFYSNNNKTITLPFRLSFGLSFGFYGPLLFWQSYWDVIIMNFLVDGNWGEWSKWGTCTKTCKQGKQSRTRVCNSPAPQYGGSKCQGDSSQFQDCNRHVPCPSKLEYRLFCNECWSQRQHQK